MKKEFKWGVISPGRIAHTFAKALKVVPNATIHAVASSSQERADVFAAEYGIPHAYDDYAALVANPDIDAVYIASLHQQHYAHTKLALEAGKPVLCEKPFTVNAKETKELLDLAAEKKLFLMEAVWTRYLPIYETVRKWLDKGKIGDVTLLQSSFGFNPERNERGRLLNPELAGGTLLDIGIYPITVSQWVLGANPVSFNAHALIGNTGVDELLSVNLIYENGVVSQFTSTFLTQAENNFYIYGSKGYIRISGPFWGATEATLVIDGQKKKSKTKKKPFKVNGFEYEIKEAMHCIKEGLLESPATTHAHTLATMELMDNIRAEIGVKYPFEK